MTFSLILATLGRTDELSTFLDSLRAQRGVSYELILIDQNPDDRLTAVLEPFKHTFAITHLRSLPGLSKARNLGLCHTTGDVVAFPDDDCQYPPALLTSVAAFFAERPDVAGLTGRALDEQGQVSAGRPDPKTGFIDPLNVWRRGVSVSIFLRRQALTGVRFDEALGAGACWGSGEETDFLVQLLERGAQLVYDPRIVVFHPSPQGYTEQRVRKAYLYGCGMGYVLKKHRYPSWFKAHSLIRPLGGSLLSLVSFRVAKARYHWNVFKGRWAGLR